MRVNVAAEGGGTKTVALLYDDDLRLLNVASEKGSNYFFRPIAEVRAGIGRLVDELFSGRTDAVAQKVDVALMKSDGIFFEAVKRRTRVEKTTSFEEGRVAMACSGSRYGIVAISGTGSSVFLIRPAAPHRLVGGWGPLLGDEGSGYEIGLNAVKAAIFAEDGRGPATQLRDRILAHFGQTHLRGIIEPLAESAETRMTVASLARIVAEAARDGDEVAVGIYRKAGAAVAEQVAAMISSENGRFSGPVSISGGAWKGHPAMFETFSERVRAVCPQARIIRPYCEPVAGVVACRLYENGMSDREVKETIRAHFPDFCL